MSWYRKWSDGWIEQGGVAKGNSTVTLPIQFKDANYALTATGNSFYTLVWAEKKTNSNFFTTGWQANTGAYPTKWEISWNAMGY